MVGSKAQDEDVSTQYRTITAAPATEFIGHFMRFNLGDYRLFVVSQLIRLTSPRLGCNFVEDSDFYPKIIFADQTM